MAKDETAERETPQVRPVQRAGATPKVKWDDSGMRSAYANVCNATGTREEVVLFFGISNPTQGDDGQGEVTVQLSDRIILSPFAAKRLATLLNNVVSQYETRFGSLSQDLTQAAATAPIGTKN